MIIQVSNIQKFEISNEKTNNGETILFLNFHGQKVKMQMIVCCIFQKHSGLKYVIIIINNGGNDFDLKITQ